MSSVKWGNGRSLEIIKASPSKPRKFLVFVVPRGDMKSPLLDFGRRERNFDLAVRFYDDPGLNSGLLEDAEFVMTGGLSKFHSAALFLDALNLKDHYDGYLFLDGDLEFEPRRIEAFLSLARSAQLDLAQPSLTRDSYCYWTMAYHQPGYVLRETSFVEVMAPYLSRFALAKTSMTFTRSISTYGLDLTWPALIEGGKIGVVDAFQIRHRERVNHASGNFYKYLKSIDVDLDEEERQILKEYNVKPKWAHSCRGYFWRRSPRNPNGSSLHSVALPGAERFSNSQKFIDLVYLLARKGPGRVEASIQDAIGPLLSGDSVVEAT